MSAASRKIIIIGGGITGLAAAHELTRSGNDVTLVEAADQLGGLGTSFKSGTNWVDKFYHCQMPTDEHLLKLIHDVGLADQIYWKPTHMGFIVNGTRYPFNTPRDVLRFKPISFVQRIRFGLVSLFIRQLGRGLDLDNTRIEDWFSRLYSKGVWERILRPLFCSKFGSHGGNLPALYIWQRLGREKNVAKRGYIKGGLKAFIDAIAARIESYRGSILTNAPVRTIDETKNCMKVTLGNGRSIDCDWVISTLSLPILKEIIRGSRLFNSFRDPDLTYQGVVNALFFLSRPLDNYYWSPVVNSGTEFDGVVEMTELVEKSQYDNRYLVYVMKYCSSDSKLFCDDEETIRERWSKQLMKLYADIGLKEEHILETHVFKAPYVEPVYQIGYARRKPDVRVGHSKLILATTAQIYPYITSWNTCVKLAHDTVSYLRETDRSVQ